MKILSAAGYKFFYSALSAVSSVLILQNTAFCQVSVFTDKNAYKIKESVNITVKNSYESSVFTVAAGKEPQMSIVNLERKASVGWDALALRCRQPSCKQDHTVPEPDEIKPSSQVIFAWQPRIFMNNKYIAPDPGTYRLTILYQKAKEGDQKKWNWTTVRSNNFTLE
jgi:hypothetical protein